MKCRYVDKDYSVRWFIFGGDGVNFRNVCGDGICSYECCENIEVSYKMFFLGWLFGGVFDFLNGFFMLIWERCVLS